LIPVTQNIQVKDELGGVPLNVLIDDSVDANVSIDENATAVEAAVELIEAVSKFDSSSAEHVSVGVDAGISADIDIENLPVKKIRYRADVKWSWSNWFLMHRVNSWMCAMRSKPGVSQAVCMVARKEGRIIPIGMLTLVPSFLCTILNDKRHRAYTWYLSDAPREFYSKALSVTKIDHLARALLDYTVQAGSCANQNISLVLRADKNGGQRLRDWYEGCGMSALPETHPNISPMRFLVSRAGYFNLKAEKSKEFCQFLDVYRGSRDAKLLPVKTA
jgi:hypothetical protein